MKQKTRAENPTKKELCRERRRLILLSVGGFLASILPLALLLALRWEKYTAVPGGAVRLCFGGGVIAVLILLKVLGKLKLPSRLTVMVTALVLVYLLEALLFDVTLILWMAILGETLDTFLFSPFLRRTRARMERLRQADVTAGAVEELLKTYVGGREP